MKRVCAWCKCVMYPGDYENAPVTHGICPECLIKLNAEINDYSGGENDNNVQAD